MMKKILTLLLAILLAATLFVGCDDNETSNVKDNDNEKTTASSEKTEHKETATGDFTPAESTPESAAEDTSSTTLDTTKTYYADIIIENYGTITLELDPSAAPKTVENFVHLADSGFYDGLTFHRIMEGFMMQGGDPKGDGTGGSNANIAGEFIANGYNNPLSHTRGTISMARSQAYNSASSQFFIMHQDNTGLDGLYAAFGHVIEGIEVVDAVCTTAQPTDNNGTIPAQEQPIIQTVTIRAE